MTSVRKIEANRRNSARSTGPQTADGKMRSKSNAMKHGLAAITLAQPKRSDEIERLTTALAEGSSDPERLALARAAAEAELELRMLHELRTLALRLATKAVNESGMLYSGVNEHLPTVLKAVRQHARLERYVRRAFSKRNGLFRRLSSS
jgi:hypothetical protein